MSRFNSFLIPLSGAIKSVLYGTVSPARNVITSKAGSKRFNFNTDKKKGEKVLYKIKTTNYYKNIKKYIIYFTIE